MTVICPSCHTRYSLDESLVKSPQQKMRCSRCGQLFVFTSTAPQPILNETVDKTDVQQLDSSGDTGQTLQEDSREKPAEQLGKTGNRRKTMGVVIGLVILALLSGAAYVYWNNFWRAGDRWLRLTRLEGQEVSVQDGRIFLVTGVVKNSSSKGRKSVPLRIKLFDQDGKVIDRKECLAGMVLSKQQILALDKADIENRVNAFHLSSPEVFRLDAGKEIRFSSPFFDAPSIKAKEFSVEIIRSNAR